MSDDVVNTETPLPPEVAEGSTPPAQPKSVGSLISVPNPKSSIERTPVVGFVWALYRGYSRRNGPLLSAGIAYYALFSMGPLALLTFNIAGRLFGDATPGPSEKLISVLQEYLGEEMARLLASAVAQVKGPQGYSFAIVGIGILLYGATRLFVRLQASFNIMWDVRIVSREFSFRRLMSRLLVFGMILVPTVLLVVAVVLSAAVSWLARILEHEGFVIGFAQLAIPFVISWLALLVIFVVLPAIRLSWRDCWFTTLLVALAWTVTTHVFGRYLSWSGGANYAGAAGALVGLIFWTDIMAIITLVGVRFNKALYLWSGKVIQPYDYAALLTELPDVDAAPSVAVPPSGEQQPDAQSPRELSGGSPKAD